ncbi:MAG TPA: class I SAM-dependent methyltransferase [Candidatus Krumholzibacteria bacterium]|nr:class I SAM-dependent methyltransferase [Candidatus Krumholzibacteria bacterium]HRX50474.1 class I SAM-dependent methyltransferase [Candidatus Krumholzibacteria bacterium]
MSRPWYEIAFGAHYPALYRHRDQAEAVRAVDAVARCVPLRNERVLDLGCGAGRHLEPLRAHGAEPVGMDLSPHLLAEARRTGAAAPLLRGDWTRIPLRDGSCGAVLSLFTAFGYGDDPAQRRMVAEVARVLRGGGRWCLDYLNPRAVRRELADPPPPRRRELEGFRVTETRRLDGDRSRVLKTVAVERPGAEPLTYTESVALLELSELDALAAAAGLARTAALGGYDGAPLDPDVSPRWLLVYGKEAAA